MARGLDPAFLQQLKNKNDLVEVIGGYVHLEKKGGNYWACCPFHHEKTPSFSINAAEQFYHCFGCGVSGDVITFIREIESVDFIDAVRILAERAKLPMPEMNLHLIGSFAAARLIASLATASEQPLTSKSILPGFTGATQYSTAPFPFPIRTSRGFFVYGL